MRASAAAPWQGRGRRCSLAANPPASRPHTTRPVTSPTATRSAKVELRTGFMVFPGSFRAQMETVAHTTPLALETLLGFAEVDVAARERLKDLDAIAGGGGRRRRTLVEPELGEQGVEAEPGGRIAHLQVVLELLHVAPGGEEHAQQLALVAAQGAELACLEVA